MGWEFFNSLPGDRERPWEWAEWMTKVIRRGKGRPVEEIALVEEKKTDQFVVIDESLDSREEALLPETFEYFTDGSIDD